MSYLQFCIVSLGFQFNAAFLVRISVRFLGPLFGQFFLNCWSVFITVGPLFCPLLKLLVRIWVCFVYFYSLLIFFCCIFAVCCKLFVNCFSFSVCCQFFIYVLVSFVYFDISRSVFFFNIFSFFDLFCQFLKVSQFVVSFLSVVAICCQLFAVLCCFSCQFVFSFSVCCQCLFVLSCLFCVLY